MEVKPLRQDSVPAGFKRTEVGVIPKEWDVKLLRGVAQIRSGIAKNANTAISDPVPVHYLRVANVQDGFLDLSEMNKIEVSRSDLQRFAVLPGDVLMNEGGDRDKLGRGSIWRGEFQPCIHQNHVFVVRCGSQVVPDYLTNWSAGSIARRYFLVAGKQTTNLASINKTALGELPVLVPNVTEQAAIAEALSDADSFIESLEQLLAKKRQLKQGAMQELLTGKKRLPGFERKRCHKQTEIGVIPEDWEVRPLLTAVRIAQGQVDPKVEPFKSMFLVGPAHVESGSGKLVNRQTAAEQGAISGKYLFAEGDIIYGKINPYLQKAFLADFSGLCSADMYPLKPSKDVSPGFMLAVILGHRFTKYAESVSVRSGMPKINRTEMAEFIFPIPSDKAEQTAIATILSDMDAEIAALEAKLTKARQIKQGMMQELLTGRIRLVPPSASGGNPQC